LIRTEQRAADVQSVKALLASLPRTSEAVTTDNPWKEEKAESLLRKCLEIWTRPTPRLEFLERSVINKVQIQSKKTRLQIKATESPLMVGESHLVSRSDGHVKKGHLMLLVDAQSNIWDKRWFVLRRPYLHVYSQPNELDDLDIIGMEGSKIEFDPSTDALFGRHFVFTIFTPTNSYALAAPSSKELRDWVNKLDPTR